MHVVMGGCACLLPCAGTTFTWEMCISWKKRCGGVLWSTSVDSVSRVYTLLVCNMFCTYLGRQHCGSERECCRQCVC